MYRIIGLLLPIALFGTVLVSCDFRPPVFTINLNDKPEDRWVNISAKFKQYAPGVRNLTRQFIPQEFEKIIFYFAEKVEKFFTPEIADELRGIANGSGLPLGDVVLINLIYDLTAFDNKEKIHKFCTSIVAQDANGTIWHGRNLDYVLKSFMQNITIVVDFKLNNQTVFTSITVPFFAGVITGQRPGAFAISVNERDTGPWWFNVLMALFTEMRYPLSFAVREVLQYETNFLNATKRLSNIHLIAPCYLIVSGTKLGEGVIITRDRISPADTWYLEPFMGNWYIIETNYDHWKPAGDKRREVAEKALNATGAKSINADTMFAVLSKTPVLNNFTSYTTVMSAAHPTTYYQYTLLRNGTNRIL